LQNKKIVITIGRMSKLDGNNKGYRRVIDAMSEVIKTVPRAIYLLVGSGDDVSDVRELIQKKNLEKHVFVIPAPTNEELVDYYNVADVFAMPSKNEGFPPIVILEALACGVPVVAGNQRGAEALIANKFGVVVPSDDVSAVSHAIVKILMGQDFNRQTLHKNIVEIFGMETYKERVRQFITHIHV
ncbi:glycosyltransferase family 4 protein, partial [Candidatus Woesearchaeota archaeon]|nr:glycosyltransferase family 4 protein [Candidatus Woesearchaeota archaeon]